MRSQSASKDFKPQQVKYNLKVLDKYQSPRKSAIVSPTKNSRSIQPTASSTIIDFRTNSKLIIRPSTTQIQRAKIPMNVQTFFKKVRKLQQEEKRNEFREHYSPIVQKMQVKEESTPQQWIGEFVRNQLAHSAALTIQRAWRAYHTRKMWGGIFNKRIWFRKDVLQRIFIGWRGAACNDFDKKYHLYERFYHMQEEKPWLTKKTNLSPWFLFYTTNKWFFPKLYNARTFAYIVRVFSRSSMRYILRTWKNVTKSRIGFRENSGKFLFTMKKRHAFGFPFIALILWHRYTEWKKLSKERVGAFSLNSTEFVIDWHVREKALNFKKARKTRANEHYLEIVKKRAHMAIHQHLVERRQFQADLDASHQFYMHRLLENGKKAWLKFIDQKKRKNQNLLRLQRIWYLSAYEMAKKKHSLNSLSLYHSTGIKSIFFEAWRKQTHISELQIMISACKIYQNPSIPRHAIFKFLHEEEFIVFEKSFKEWIAYTKRRIAFKNFLDTFNRVDDERITKQTAFYNLKRAADHNIIRRLVHPSTKFFPYQTFLCIEGINKDMEFYRKEKAQFRFLTEMKPMTQEIDKFVILIVLFLDKIMKFDRAKFSFNTEQISVKPKYNVMTLAELRQIYNESTLQMKERMKIKMKRDKMIVLNVDSYRAAMNYKEIDPNFTVAEENGIKLPNYLIRTPEPIEIPENVLFSLKEYLEETRNSKFIIPPKLHSIITKERKLFNSKLRHPTIIYGTQTETTKEQQSTSLLQNQQQGKSRDRVTLVSFIKPGKQENIPFIHPSLECVKQLSSGSELQNFKISSLLDLHTNFGSSLFINKLESADYINNLRRFFIATTGIKLEIKPQEETNLSPQVKRQHRRNIATFVAGLCGIDASKSVPINFEKPQWITSFVQAIIGAHKELKRIPSLAVYCGDTSFPSKLPIDSDDAVELRHFINIGVSKKYPKLSKKEPTLRKPNDADDFCQQDLYVSMFALPYIIKPECVRDFIKDEIKLEK